MVNLEQELEQARESYQKAIDDWWESHNHPGRCTTFAHNVMMDAASRVIELTDQIKDRDYVCTSDQDD